MTLEDDSLIYLDLDFISRKYEDKFGTDPGTKVTKQQGSKADVTAFFANAGITTQESRTYSITSRSMLHSLWKMLKSSYPEFRTFENYKGTKIFWMEGRLTLGEWVDSKGIKPGHEFYQLNHDSDNGVRFT